MTIFDVLASVIVPVFAQVLAGYAVARLLALPARWINVLNRVTFDLAVPVLLFHTMATIELPDQVNVTLFAAYYLPTLGLYAALMGLAHWRGRALATGNVLGLAGTYSNAVLLGIPLILRAYGDAAALPLFALISVHAALLFFVASLNHEFGQRRGGVVRVLFNTVSGLARNAILIGLLAGLAVNLLDVQLPAPLMSVTATIRTVAPHLALLTMGVGLAGYALRGAVHDAALMSAAKLVVHPLCVAAGLWWVDLPRLWENVMLTMAALPCGINVYLFAVRFRQLEAASATGILVSTLISALTLTLLLTHLR